MAATHPATSNHAALIDERELTLPVDLCLSDGRLNPAAIGWSRRPLHHCKLEGRWGRKKQWDYWCVTTADHMISFTYANIDYVGLASVAFLDFNEKRWLERTVVIPFAMGFVMPDLVGGHDIEIDVPGLQLGIHEEPDGTVLVAGFTARSGERVEANVHVALPPSHETLTVLVPWSERVFQLTSKHNTRPARGRVVVSGRAHEFNADNRAFGCLDYGRGIWPYRTEWNWSSASGVCNGTTIGLQLGGKWTEGTGATENALCINGRLSKISEHLEYEYDRHDFQRPWKIRTPASNRIDLTFTPFYQKRVKGQLVLLSGELNLCFGHYAGTVIDDDGTRHQIDDLLGWSEEVRARW